MKVAEDESKSRRKKYPFYFVTSTATDVKTSSADSVEAYCNKTFSPKIFLVKVPIFFQTNTQFAKLFTSKDCFNLCPNYQKFARYSFYPEKRTKITMMVF